MNSRLTYRLLTFIRKAEKVAPMISLIFFLHACTASVSKGVKKDFTTGLTTSFTRMQPQKALLVMNGEELHHTDIPVGESFILMNDGIEGQVTNNGTVRLGCSLTIAYKSGAVLFKDNDLFLEKDMFREEEAKLLKCTIHTGAPMQSGEQYDVTVVFWDKYGKGSIENKFTINMIDMP
jgi:hypothetical protein